jgi:hypothetical protein
MPTTIDIESPYTQQQWQVLDPERQQVIGSVAEYLSGEKLPQEPTDEALSEALNLLRPCKGCVPEEEIDDLAKSIRKKFAAIYWTGTELAIQELHRRGHQSGQEFTLYLVIDPDPDDYTYVTVVDPDKGRCFLHEGHKPWHFHFDSLAEIADAVLSVRNLLVNKVTDALAKEQQVFVVVEGGLVQEVVDLPNHIRLTVIDHDIQETCGERLEKSPLNHQPCYLSHY